MSLGYYNPRILNDSVQSVQDHYSLFFILDLSYLKVLFYGCPIKRGRGRRSPGFDPAIKEMRQLEDGFGPLQRRKWRNDPS